MRGTIVLLCAVLLAVPFGQFVQQSAVSANG
jgi:hypothetical protein